MNVIGISGVAGSGKDLFYSLLSARLNTRRLALADELKRELRDFSISYYGIDPINCNREDKEKIRSLLVFHGNFKRKQTEGRYWIEKLNKTLDSSLSNQISCITDIRYSEYKNDEVQWLKKERKGVLVHISRILKDGGIHQAPNEFERNNDPILKNEADYRVYWHTTNDIAELDCYIDKFIKWLDKR